MPPQLALAAGGLLVAALLFFDMRRTRVTSRAMILPILWLIYTASKSITFWLGGDVATSTTEYKQGSPLDRNFLILLMAAGIFVLSNRRIAWNRFIKENRWLIALFGWMLLSAIWSEYTTVSGKRWVRSAGDAMMMLIVLTDDDPFEAVRILIRRTSAVMLPMSLVLIKYYRPLGVTYDYTGTLEMWAGVTTDKNTLGVVCAFAILFFVWDIMINRDRRERVVNVILLLFALYLLMGSESSRSMTSVVVTVVGIALLLAFRLAPQSYRTVCKIGLVGTATAIAIPIVATLALRIPLIGELMALLGRDATFTGRVYLWDYLLNIAADNRLIGVGFGGFWIGNAYDMWTMFQWGPTQGHNGYVDVYLQLGLVGLGILAGVAFTAYRNLRSKMAASFPFNVLLMVFLLMALVHNCTESTLLRGTLYVWDIFLLSCLRIPGSVPVGESVRA